jgi:sterol desaturase/sphingolipid hydroxylase (fatty acid hydroxylase superfamily)
MMAFDIGNHGTWKPWQYLAFGGVVLGGLEVLSYAVNHLDTVFSGRIPKGGKPLEVLSTTDKLFIGFNKATTTLFTYHVISLAWNSEHVAWDLKDMTLLNTVGSYAAFHLVYDFFYMWFHRILHMRAVYPYVHKHHHRQVVPFRGNLDAVNVHPFEFVVGEYLHLLSIYLVPSHAVAVGAFIVLGGLMASLNHTRYDARVKNVYEVRYHDIHHRIPTVNYGQYIMFWDRVFGSYKPAISTADGPADGRF